jgi:hypothetical protein
MGTMRNKGGQQDGCFCYEYGTLAIKVSLFFKLAVDFSSSHFLLCHGETKEGWPLLTVETEGEWGLKEYK